MRKPSPRKSFGGREGRPRTDELAAVADKLEEQARALMDQARQLRQMTVKPERAEGSRPFTPRAGQGGAAKDGARERAPRRPDDETRARKKPGKAPSWAPTRRGKPKP